MQKNSFFCKFLLKIADIYKHVFMECQLNIFLIEHL